MNNSIAIKVNDLHKSFDFAASGGSSIKQIFVNIGHDKKPDRQKVLDGISFEIKKGEFFGIVGKNGSGKSTLLKLLAGVYTPDAGSIEVNGRLTPFIELGVGFNPELTGRDNVYLSASLLGFTREQVNEIYDEIVDFSELHEHMDKKLKNYSSGMQVRLAFSIAVKAKNDILIFDEVLAVGDEAFQKKCIKIFEEYRRKKQTVILVTHNMDSVRSLCTRALMLSDGRVELIGGVDEVSNAYSQSNLGLVTEQKDIVNTTGNLKGLKLKGCKRTYHPGDVMKIKIEWPQIEGVTKAGVAIIGSNGEYIFGTNTGNQEIPDRHIDYSVNLDLGPGNYFLTVAIYDQDGESLGFYEKIWSFLIYDDFNNEANGQVRLGHSYSLIEK